MKKVDPFYKTKAWIELRKKALRRDGYRDQLLLREGKSREATTVHHALPIDRYPEYALKLWNLVSVTDATHEALHNRVIGGLSYEGELLMREVAEKNGIKLSHLTLVVGLPGSGKTTYVKEHLGNGLCYDLDYIAGAFRLKKPHEEDHRAARRLANSMVRAFAVNARRQASRVFVIRTAPTIEEVIDIDPDEIVVTSRRSERINKLKEDNETDLTNRISEIISWAEANGVGVSLPPGG